MLFQSDLGESPPERVIDHFEPAGLREAGASGGESEGSAADEGSRTRKALSYGRRLVEETLAHREEIDELIEEQARNWRLERMSVVDRNILRLAVYELLFEHDVPELVVIDEAIELAKTFGSDESGSFVNGVLDGLLKSDRFERRR